MAAAGTGLIRRQVADKPAAIADLHPAAMKTSHDTMGRSRLCRAFSLPFALLDGVLQYQPAFEDD